MNIKQHRAGSIGIIGYVNGSFCQIPDEPRIHRTEKKPARLRVGSCPRHMFQNPCNFGRAEISVGNQPRLTSDYLLQRVAVFGCPAALPYDGVIHRLARLFIPYDGGFPLVGNSDAADIFGPRAHNRHGFRCHGNLRRPDFHGVMLYPPGLRINLCKLLLLHTADISLFVKQNAAGTGSSLIQRHNIFVHCIPPVFSIPHSW